jgi:amino acid transporter
VIWGYFEPSKLKNDRRTEIINEVIITFIFYTFLCFSDLVPDLQIRAFIGSMSCLLVMLHFLANVGVIVYFTLSKCREKARKRRLKLKKKRLIADGVL